jgi:phosphoglycerol transferase MdoB-like AlkP superfamily enzyme
LQYDENGNVILDMREFLEDGTKNPKFGKVKKKDITPNLQQFFKK